MRIARVIAGAILAILSLEAARAASGTAFSAAGTAGRILFVAACVAAAAAGRPSRRQDGRWRVPAAAFAVLALGVAGAAAARVSGSIVGALAAVAAFFSTTLAAALVPARPGRRLSRALLVIALAAAAGTAAMGAVEIESRFADEEIFAALAVLPLSVAWLGCWFAARSLPPGEARRSVAVRPGAIALLAAGLAVAGLVFGVAAYQHSFSADDPPPFPGISDAHPFLCGPGRPDPAVFSGPERLRLAPRPGRGGAPRHGARGRHARARPPGPGARRALPIPPPRRGGARGFLADGRDEILAVRGRAARLLLPADAGGVSGALLARRRPPPRWLVCRDQPTGAAARPRRRDLRHRVRQASRGALREPGDRRGPDRAARDGRPLGARALGRRTAATSTDRAAAGRRAFETTTTPTATSPSGSRTRSSRACGTGAFHRSRSGGPSSGCSSRRSRTARRPTTTPACRRSCPAPPTSEPRF